MLLAGLGKRSVDDNGKDEDVDEEVEENEGEESPKNVGPKRKQRKARRLLRLGK